MSFLVYKGFEDWLGLEAGADFRLLEDQGDESDYNHEFSRYFASASVWDVFAEGLEANVTGEVWDAAGNDYTSLSGEVGYQIIEEVKASVGTSYSLYKYDYYLDSEREDIQTYYSKVRYEPWKSTRLELGYEFEQDDYDDYHTVNMKVTYRF